MSHTTRSERKSEEGFTLIEVIVALALVSIVLAAIGSLFAANARGVRTLQQHVSLVETARLVATSIPRGAELPSEGLAGEVSGHLWQVRSSPFVDGGAFIPESRFLPVRIELQVQSPSGAIMSFETVRLQNRGGRQ